MDIIVTHKSSTIAFAIVVVFLVLVILWLLWSVLNWVWLRPKKLERCLRKQGLKGNSYRLLFGDMKESSKMVKEAQSSPISISDDILPRVIPSIHKTLLTHGKSSFIWFGPTPNVNIWEPELVKEILTKNFDFPKPKTNPLVDYLATGLATYEGEKWTKHRKLINPAFHMEKLKEDPGVQLRVKFGKTTPVIFELQYLHGISQTEISQPHQLDSIGNNEIYAYSSTAKGRIYQ